MAVRRNITAHEEIRRRCGRSVTELARETGFSHAYVSRVEGGNLRPSPRYRAEVAQALGVPEELIFGPTRRATDVSALAIPEKRTPGLTGREGVRDENRRGKPS